MSLPLAQLGMSGASASGVARTLRVLGNERRLMILCALADCGEAAVHALARTVALSPSALSQHLARMRVDGIVTFRRQGQTLWYRISDPRIHQLMAELHRLYCRA